MSVQLILFPQNYKGYSATTVVPNNQFVADKTQFLTLLNHSGYDSSDVYPGADAINNDLAIASWKRYRSFSNPQWADAPMPSRSNANRLELYCNAGASASQSGVYQRIIGLTPYVNYDLSITITQASSVGGIITIGTQGAGNITVTPTTLQDGTFYAALGASVTGIQTVTFQADSSDEILLVNYTNSGGSTVHIGKISITESAQQPTQIYSDLNDGQVICDLYEEEDIPLSLSVDDFKNVAEKVQSYSKDFNLPATKRNNKIFNHIFDVTRTDNGIDFNPYVKTKCVLKQDGYTLFDGFLRLIDISNKEGEISYNVNLYDEVIALADILKNRTFQDLSGTFAELEHDYNKSNIKNSWNEPPTANAGILLTTPLGANSFAGSQGDTRTQVLKYPFVDWTGGISLAISTNLGSGTGPINARPELEKLEDAFRPYVNCKYLLDNIFFNADFTYTSDFLNSDRFTKLFMDFNFTGETPSETMIGKYGFQSGITTIFSNTTYQNIAPLNSINFTNQVGWNNTQKKFVGQSDNVGYRIDYYIHFRGAATNTVDHRIIRKDSGGNIIQTYYSNSFSTSSGNSVLWNNTLYATINTNETIEFQFKSSVNNGVSLFQNGANGTSFHVSVGLTTVINTTLLNSRRGELGQWDFISGILTMFNLVTIKDPDNPKNILIEPYSDVFIKHSNSGVLTDLSLASRGIKYDWTDKVDVTQIDLKPLELIKQTTFKYEEDDDDYAFRIYKGGTGGKLYGAEVFVEQNMTLLQGEEEIVATPFAATVIKPLFDRYPNLLAPAIYTSNDEQTEFEGYDNLPRILYNNGKKTIGASYYIPSQNGYSSENQSDFLQFSHLSEINPTTSTTEDYNFGASQLIQPAGVPFVPSDNLYNLYYAPYYNELYDSNTRIMTLKVNLNPVDINSFNFDETVMIQNRVYRVNKIEYKPNDLSTVEFILIT